MFGFTRLHYRQQPPGIQRKVFEVQVAGPIGKWMSDRNWAGTTLAFPFFVVILYWVGPKLPEPKAICRVHEFEHVAQIQDNHFFFIFWIKYLIQTILHGYRNNKFEREAYLLQQSWSDRRDLPDWAKP